MAVEQVRLEVVVENGKAVEAVKKFGKVTKQEADKAGAAMQRAGKKIERASFRGRTSFKKMATNSQHATNKLAGVGAGVSAVDNSLALLGARGPSQIATVTSALGALLGSGLGPLSLALVALTGASGLFFASLGKGAAITADAIARVKALRGEIRKIAFEREARGLRLTPIDIGAEILKQEREVERLRGERERSTGAYSTSELAKRRMSTFGESKDPILLAERVLFALRRKRVELTEAEARAISKSLKEQMLAARLQSKSRLEGISKDLPADLVKIRNQETIVELEKLRLERMKQFESTTADGLQAQRDRIEKEELILHLLRKETAELRRQEGRNRTKRLDDAAIAKTTQARAKLEATIARTMRPSEAVTRQIAALNVEIARESETQTTERAKQVDILTKQRDVLLAIENADAINKRNAREFADAQKAFTEARQPIDKFEKDVAGAIADGIGSGLRGDDVDALLEQFALSMQRHVTDALAEALVKTLGVEQGIDRFLGLLGLLPNSPTKPATVTPDIGGVPNPFLNSNASGPISPDVRGKTANLDVTLLSVESREKADMLISQASPEVKNAIVLDALGSGVSGGSGRIRARRR